MDGMGQNARAVRPRRGDNEWWTSRAYECRDKRAVVGRDAHRRLEDPPGAGELALNAVKGVLPAEPLFQTAEINCPAVNARSPRGRWLSVGVHE